MAGVAIERRAPARVGPGREAAHVGIARIVDHQHLGEIVLLGRHGGDHRGFAAGICHPKLPKRGSLPLILWLFLLSLERQYTMQAV